MLARTLATLATHHGWHFVHSTHHVVAILARSRVVLTVLTGSNIILTVLTGGSVLASHGHLILITLIFITQCGSF